MFCIDVDSDFSGGLRCVTLLPNAGAALPPEVASDSRQGERFSRQNYFRDVRAHLQARLEERNALPVPVAKMTPEAKAALIVDLLRKMHDV